MLRSLKDAFSQFERLQTAARTRAALAVKRQRRERVGTVPYGYALDAAGHLAELDLEQQAIERMRALRSGGLSYRAIGDKLTRAGQMQRNGNAWHPQMVSVIIGRDDP